ncbi:hypothetical protein HHK36_017228 [Tetracentron sinense]|uniref:Essential protein Yae1 N-terminal domain-containing protein n=1 Tax=Tetracentron sinense TaxID=13715 RepID=A0A834Z6U0_TETSI|nr:hypothetical protein HHK36_017228 [Tetracentron sinense]
MCCYIFLLIYHFSTLGIIFAKCLNVVELPAGFTDMENSFAEKLYSSVETLKLSNIEIDRMPTANSQQTDSYDCDGDDLWCEDGSLCDSPNQALDKASELDREWQRRHNQFHTIGYRDGLMAGKEASAQEGFNIGFKQSVLVGYNWGLVRGVTSALVCLPDGLKEKLVGTLEKREKFQNLYESVHSLSTADALSLFRDDVLASRSKECSEQSEGDSHVATMEYQISGPNHLERYFVELESYILESPAVKVHSAMDL